MRTTTPIQTGTSFDAREQEESGPEIHYPNISQPTRISPGKPIFPEEAGLPPSFGEKKVFINTVINSGESEDPKTSAFHF